MASWVQIVDRAELPLRNQRVFVWGAGNTAELAHQGMLRENLYDELNIVAFLDTKAAGRSFHGFKIEHPEILTKVDPKAVFVLICTWNRWMLEEMQERLAAWGIQSCLLEVAIAKLRKESLLKAQSLFDEKSSIIFSHVLYNRLALYPFSEDLYAGESYFGIPEFCCPRSDDVVIDCGAYVGDTLERFIWRLEQWGRIIAIEPDVGNYQALCQRVERLRHEWNLANNSIITMNAAVDSHSSQSRIAVDTRNRGLGSVLVTEDEDGECGIPVYAIDDLIKHFDWQDVTFLKADIESFEYRMLNGAKQLIGERKPRLAICIYHSLVDMYSIPLLIARLNPSYHFSLRHHSFTNAETVLYAY